MDDDEEYPYLAAHQGIEAAGLEKVHISGGFPVRRTNQILHLIFEKIGTKEIVEEIRKEFSPVLKEC
ncbi:MAG: hypothetical protein K9N10_04015 [Deltaproteobacteria bacterium]|nr:hypothetical protein [Deltaproteobacteria bacterium]